MQRKLVDIFSQLQRICFSGFSQISVCFFFPRTRKGALRSWFKVNCVLGGYSLQAYRWHTHGCFTGRKKTTQTTSGMSLSAAGRCSHPRGRVSEKGICQNNHNKESLSSPSTSTHTHTICFCMTLVHPRKHNISQSLTTWLWYWRKTVIHGRERERKKKRDLQTICGIFPTNMQLWNFEIQPWVHTEKHRTIRRRAFLCLLISHTISLEYIYCPYLNVGDTVAYIRQCYRKQTNRSRFQLPPFKR